MCVVTILSSAVDWLSNVRHRSVLGRKRLGSSVLRSVSLSIDRDVFFWDVVVNVITDIFRFDNNWFAWCHFSQFVTDAILNSITLIEDVLGDDVTYLPVDGTARVVVEDGVVGCFNEVDSSVDGDTQRFE